MLTNFMTTRQQVIFKIKKNNYNNITKYFCEKSLLA